MISLFCLDHLDPSQRLSSNHFTDQTKSTCPSPAGLKVVVPAISTPSSRSGGPAPQGCQQALRLETSSSSPSGPAASTSHSGSLSQSIVWLHWKTAATNVVSHEEVNTKPSNPVPPFQPASYLIRPTFHVFEVSFGYGAPHGNYVVAVTVVGCHKCRVRSGVLLLGEEAAGVLDRRVQRVLQMVLRREARSKRR